MTAIDALTTARYADLIRLRAVRMVAPHGFGYLHGGEHIRSTVDYVREGRKNNFDAPGTTGD
jgi:hypothetical protein